MFSGVDKGEGSSGQPLCRSGLQLRLYVLFAASDAYCLLEIYEKLCKDPASFGLSSDLTKSLVGKASVKPRTKKQLNKQEVPSPSGQVRKHLQRAACCSRPLQITRCLISQSCCQLCTARLFGAASQGYCSKRLPRPPLHGYKCSLLRVPWVTFPCSFVCLCIMLVPIVWCNPANLTGRNAPSAVPRWRGGEFCGLGVASVRLQTPDFFTFAFN